MTPCLLIPSLTFIVRKAFNFCHQKQNSSFFPDHNPGSMVAALSLRNCWACNVVAILVVIDVCGGGMPIVRYRVIGDI